MVVARFPFRRIGREYLGTIQRPYATVLLQGKSRQWVSVEMVVDSGADYTLLPATYAELLGIDLAARVPTTTFGVGGSETVHLYKSLSIRLGD
ncbi:MAG: aspartyl protease family protein [candidate division WOR-3 bacterium]|nr:aspartyl protease family protein [candidate division WOR-3 bacterium]